MSTPAHAQPEEIKDEEIEEGEILTDEDDDELMMDLEDEMDMGDMLTSLLATEDGDTVCTALVAIGQQLQTQNKILIKILSELKA
tara:strand:+ start:432 stop:686 length:255 start_codon:yes stop_codon:yes gene_type:complete